MPACGICRSYDVRSRGSSAGRLSVVKSVIGVRTMHFKLSGPGREAPGNCRLKGGKACCPNQLNSCSNRCVPCAFGSASQDPPGRHRRAADGGKPGIVQTFLEICSISTFSCASGTASQDPPGKHRVDHPSNSNSYDKNHNNESPCTNDEAARIYKSVCCATLLQLQLL